MIKAVLLDLDQVMLADHTPVKPHTSAEPTAAALLALLFEKSYAVVLITDCTSPAEVIRQRLEQAGLPADLHGYALVTHSHNVHFRRHDPPLYAEVVARISVEPDEAMMVGRLADASLAAAAFVGLHTYAVFEKPVYPAAQAQQGSMGSLSQLQAALADDTWTESLLPPPLGPHMIEPEFRGNLGALFGTLSGIQPHHWHQHPDPDEWSPLQIVCHLLESEATVQRPRLERIVNENNPFLVSPPPPPGPRDALPCDSDGWKAARRFAVARFRTIYRLRQLQPSDWLRPARHSIFGPTNLLEMAHFTAQHDRLHITQLCQTIGRCT